MGFIVAIDGTAGTGKSTIAKAISKEKKFTYIDTGAMYRAITLYLLTNRIDLNDKNAIEDVLKKIDIKFEKSHDDNQIVLLNGNNVTSRIRDIDITNNVSKVSSIKEIRFKMVEFQRNMADGKDVIMEGRDITTVVFPHADVKIYLDASTIERAKRRYKEFCEKGINITLDQVEKDIIARDKQDKEKEIGALKIAEDAIYIDTSSLSILEVKEKINGIIDSKRKI